MKRPEFLETKRTPRYSLRKLHVGVASVLLGVTIFGINFTNNSVKAATTEAVANTKNSNSTSNSVQTNPQQTENTATTYANKNNAQTAVTQQDSAKDVAAGNNTTSQTTSNKHSDATTVNTDSLTTSAKAARTAATILMATSTGTGTDRNAAGTTDQNNINTQLAKENQELANKTNLTSSDNYSSNIYQGKDGKYYKIVTIYGNDYVYRAADIQANDGQTAADTKNNISISKKDLGNGKTRWTVTFFPNKGLQNVGGSLHGLISAKFGIALTNDYQIVGNVDMKVNNDPNQKYVYYKFEPGSNSATSITVQNPPAEVDFSFNPNTDVDPDTGLINSETLPAYNNKYLQGSYYFTTATNAGIKNLWQTYFKDNDEYNNAYDGSPYLGGNHDFHFSTFKIANETGVDGAKQGDPIIYDTLGTRFNSVANSEGVFSSDNFNQAMEFKSQGKSSGSIFYSLSQYSSYVVSFTTQHTDSHEVELTTGSKNQQFSGISANIYSYQNAHYNTFSRLYGEQRALNAAGVAVTPKDVISGWVDPNTIMAKIHTDYLNNAQFNVLRNKIQNNITDSDTLNNIIKEGNSLNDAMKNLGNSIGQYDPDGSFADHKVDTTKASDRYQYADPDKKSAYDKATNAVSNIISVENGTVNKSKGTYADLATVEQLTKDENDAWNKLNGVKPKDSEVNSPSGGTITIEKGHTLDSTDAANAITNKDSLTNVKSYSWSGTPDTSKPGSISPKVIVTYNDNTTDEVPVTVKIKGDADKYNPEGGEITVNRNTKLGPAEAEEAIKNAQNLPKGTTYSWAGKKLPDTSTSGQINGWVVVTYPDTSHDIVPVKINVKKDAESYTVTPKDKVSVDKGEDVDPASLVTVTDPDGKQVQLPAGSIDWKDGAKPDLTTPGDKTGSVEVTFLDGSKKDTDVTIHVKTGAETYDPQAQPWTTTVGKTPKADEVISSTDKNGKKMPSDAKYTWKTEPNTSKTGEASGEVTVTYGDGSHDDVPVTINVKDKLDDNEKYHIYGKDGLKVDKGQTLDPKDAIGVKDANGKKTTLPENSKVEWTKDKEPDFSQAGKDVTGEVTVTYPDRTVSTANVTVHVNGQSDKYKVAPRDGVTIQRGGQVDPETTVVAQTPDGKPTSFPEETKHEWVTKPDTDSTGKRTGVVKTTFPDGSTTTTTVSVTVEPNQSDKYDPKGPENPDDRVPVKDPDHLTDGDENKVKDEVGKVNPDLPKGTDVTVDDKGNATITYPDGSKDTISGGDLVRPENDADKHDPKGPENPDDRVPVKDPDHLTDGDENKVKDEVGKVNPDLPKGTDVTVDDKGNATITYPDGSKDTISGGDLVRPENDADKHDPKGPENPDDRVPVKDPDHLTGGDENKVKDEVGKVNPDLPKGTDVTVDDKGNATITYPDGSKDTISGGDLVRPENDADKHDPKGPENPDDRVPVKDPDHLTGGDENKVKDEVGKVNPDLPKGTDVTVDDKGNATITYPDGSKDTISGGDLVRPENDADKHDPKGPENPDDRVPVKDPDHLTGGDENKVKDEVGKVNPDLPKGTDVTVDDKGNATITYPDGSKDTISGGDLVRPENDADKHDPKGPENPDDRVPVKDPDHLTGGDENKVKDEVGKVNPDLPKGTDVTVDDKGNATITYPDGSKDTISGGDLVRPENDADKHDPKGPENPDDRVPVKDPDHLTGGDENKVKDEVGKVNPDLPKGTDVTVDDKGNATITYPDGSKDTISGGDLVRPENDADKHDPKGPENPDDRVPVKDPDHLTGGDENKVKDEVGKVNPDLPKGTDVTVDDKGNATITYPDGSKDTISGGDLVRPENDADKHDPKGPENPDDRVPVKDPDHLTGGDENKVKDEVGKVNPDLPKGTDVTVDDKGNATITYPDGSKDTISGGDLVRPENDADKHDPKGPENPDDRVPVKDPDHLTGGDENKVKDEVGKVNPDLPKGTDVTVDDKGNATITYPDGSKDTISGGDLVRPKKDADKITPNTPGTKVPVADPSHLTATENGEVKKNVEDANKGNFPDGTVVTVGDDGTATITYPDGSKDTIKGGDLVRPKKDADKITPNTPGTKVPVADPSHLTATENGEVKKNVEDANKGNFPDGTVVTVGDDGTATITYPDGSKDTIKGGDLVRPKKDADKITPNTPGTKVPVADPSHLTATENGEVKKNVEDANKGNFPDGTVVTVGDDGTATITYPDGSKDTIKGGDLVRPKKDADKITPNTPGTKVPVADPSHLTATENGEVKKNVEDANKGNFPDGTVVTVGDDGTATITYPDGSKDTIKGGDLVRPKKDADKITPNTPGTKVPVADPSHLTATENGEVKKNVEDANKGNFPDGTVVTVGDDGTATITYPDGSKDTIPGDQLVQGQKGDTTDAGNITPTIPGDKVTVKDPSHLTDDEKNQVKNNVDNANKDKFPAGTEVTVGDDGTATIKYPDGSKDTIPGDKVVEGKSDADKNTPNVPGGDKVKVDDPTKLTDDEKSDVEQAIKDANKDDNGKSTLPDGTTITVGDDGTTTITYPDGSTNTIPGHDLVTGKTDADKYPLNPGQAVDVVDPSHLTQAEQDQVKEAIRTANPTAPIATITVDAAGNVQVTFADGSTTTLQANLHKHVTEATTGSATKPGAGTNGGQTKGAMATNKTATKQQAQQHLPQTGDQPATWAMLSGLGVAFLGLLGLKKKKRED